VAVDFAAVGHPTLGAPPVDQFAAFPDAAARLRANSDAIAARALEVAIQRDPTFRDRHDELSLRQLLRDVGVELDRVALSVASGKDRFVEEWAEWVSPTYRKRRVPLDDLIKLSEGLRQAVRAYLGPDEMAEADRAIDKGIANFRWNRRIAGDARKRNRLLQAIYKGA
jgi:hypothetical protein